jgi:hypothetical protein
MRSRAGRKEQEPIARWGINALGAGVLTFIGGLGMFDLRDNVAQAVGVAVVVALYQGTAHYVHSN